MGEGCVGERVWVVLIHRSMVSRGGSSCGDQEPRRYLAEGMRCDLRARSMCQEDFYSISNVVWRVDTVRN